MKPDHPQAGREAPAEAGSRDYFFLDWAACFVATACCFFWFEELLFDCFWAAFLLTDFGDLSPMVFGLFCCGFLNCGKSFPAGIKTLADCAADAHKILAATRAARFF
ncbi:MAG: hypothetical protein WCH98_02605 [Verrucomicrobiota bacterium]